MKIVWRVSDVPTGRYRSFERRGWPSAYYGNADGPACARITCEDEYVPARVQTAQHQELTVLIADHSQAGPGFVWRRLKQRFTSLAQAKKGVVAALKALPPETRPEGF